MQESFGKICEVGHVDLLGVLQEWVLMKICGRGYVGPMSNPSLGRKLSFQNINGVED